MVNQIRVAGRAGVSALVLVFGLAMTLLAAEGDEKAKRNDPGPYRALASRASQGTPKIDGKLDDSIWAQAEAVNGFTQRDPNEGEPASEATEARILYDDDALYIGIRAYDSEPDKIVGRLTRRDQSSPSDWLAVSIDSYFDRRTAFEFRVNPAGVERDKYLYDDTREDSSWDAVWDVATSVDGEGWVAEFRIPLSQLRFSDAAEQIWGFNIERVIQRKNETAQWKPIPKEGSGWVSEYGELIGIRGITPGRRLEVLPYVVTQQALTPEEADNPFETGHEFNGNVGADIKYGVTNNLTLDMTINPDFGQVEADPSVVNLSAFETFFQEKRPFFLEGSNIFRYGISGDFDSEQLFYSRRIGRAPQGEADDRGGYVESPVNTTILGAAKLSGKTSNGWSIGVLDALTAEERAHVIDLEGADHRDPVEPLTNYGVIRLQRDFRGGQTAVGGIVTTVHRDLPASLDLLRSSAYSGGIDFRHRFLSGDWELTGKLLGSHIIGSTEAISEAQQSSARYYKRPDADHLEYDPNRTSLSGASGAFKLSKIGGGHWRGELSSQWVTPGFEINDAGFLRQADVWESYVWVAYREFQPGKIFRRYNLNFNLWNDYTTGGERTATGTNINGNFVLLNYWGGWGGINRSWESTSVGVLRGGPAMKRPGSWNAWGGLNSDSRKPVWFEGGGWIWSDDELSHSGGVWIDVTFRPSSSVQLTLGPEYYWNHDDWKYVTTEFALDSDRYIMGVLDQKTIEMTTRLDWTFSPNLSLQVYAQPFISSGDYKRFSQVDDPVAARYGDRFDRFAADRLTFEAGEEPDETGVYHLDLDADGTEDLSFDDPAFNFKQLRSTVVLRWEYISGSTIFFVWSQSRTRFDPTGRFRPAHDFGDLLGAEGENIFSVKVNYYLNP